MPLCLSVSFFAFDCRARLIFAVWSIGTIIGPTIGGYFAEPSSSWPDLFPADGLFGRLPYLLPNLICSVMLGCSMLIAKLFLDETHPDMQPWSTPDDLRYSTAQTPLIATSGSVANAPTDLLQESYGTFDQVSMIEGSSTDPRGERKANSRTSSSASLGYQGGNAFTPPILMLITALGMYVFCSRRCAS
jgi:MFS family permease